MRKRTAIVLATGVAACGMLIPTAVYATDAISPTAASAAAAVKVDLSGNEWHLHGSVKLPGVTAGDWKLEFDAPTDVTLTVNYGATVISGNHVTVKAMPYQQGEFSFDVPVGGKLSSYELTNFKLNGKPIKVEGTSWNKGGGGGSTTPPVTPPTTPPTTPPVTPPTTPPLTGPDDPAGAMRPGETWVSDKALQVTAEFQDWEASGQLNLVIRNTGRSDVKSWSARYGIEKWMTPGQSWGGADVTAQKQLNLLQIKGKETLKAGGEVRVSVSTTQPGSDARPAMDAGQPSSAWRGATPFLDAAAYPIPDLAQISKDTGNKQFVLGFLVGDSQGKGLPRWGHDTLTTSQYMAKQIAELRKTGGDVVVSFGGENGHELAVDSKNAKDLAKTYQDVIDRYNLNKIDFDVEGTIQLNHAANKRRAEAVRILQDNAKKSGKSLHVSLTLPTLSTGLVQDGKGVLKSFVDAGAKVDVLNVMAMMMGQSVPDMGRYGDAVIMAGINLQKQLKEFYPGKSDAELWRMVGLTPNIGKNNADGGQGVGDKGVVSVADMKKIEKFAAEKNIGMLSMWSIGRDQSCANGAVSFESTCSGVKQSKYDFSKALSQYKKEWTIGK